MRRRSFLAGTACLLACPAIVRAATGKIRLFCTIPSPNNSSPATMALEVNGTNVPITDNCGGLQQFFNLLTQTPALDGEVSGAQCSGSAPNGIDNCILFLQSPVDLPSMQLGRVDMGALTLQVAHNGAYGIRMDSLMNTSIDWRGGQLVLKPDVPNQIGLWVRPRSPWVQDPNGPAIGQARITFPSIVAVRGMGQVLALIDHSQAPIGATKFDFTEPNGGDFGVCVTGAGHGFIGNSITVFAAHGQKYGCIDIGHGANVTGGGNFIKGTVCPEPGFGTGLDYWGHDDIVDLQITGGDTGNGARGITMESGSYNLQCRIGQNVAVSPIVLGPGSGHPKPNMINGTAYQA